MRISQVDNPEYFQRLVRALFAAEYGVDFQVVDDSGGDGGNDGYLRARRVLFAIYCPEKEPKPQRLRGKIKADLQKAVTLRDEKGYVVHTWIFVTPHDLREPEQRYVRDEAAKFDIEGMCLGYEHLTDLWLKHSHLHGQFADVESPVTLAKLDEILQGQWRLEGAFNLSAVYGHSVHSTPKTERPQLTPSIPLLLGRLHDLELRMLRGDGGAVVELETLRLESREPQERLWATIVLISGLDRTDTGHLDRIERLCQEALKTAQSTRDLRAETICRTELAWALNYRYTVLDIDSYFTAMMWGMAGIPLGHAKLSQLERDLTELAKSAEQQFSDAMALAKAHGLYRDLTLVLRRRANARAGRLLLSTKVPELQHVGPADLPIMEREYEACIQLSAWLDYHEGVALGYHNYANDLGMLGVDPTRARALAARALEIEQQHNLEHLLPLTRGLIAFLHTESSVS